MKVVSANQNVYGLIIGCQLVMVHGIIYNPILSPNKINNKLKRIS
jgi:hypothetical protein